MNSITDEVVIKSSGRSVYRVSLVVVLSNKECRFFAGYRKDRENSVQHLRVRVLSVVGKERNILVSRSVVRIRRPGGPAQIPVGRGCGCGSERRRSVVYMASASISKKQQAG